MSRHHRTPAQGAGPRLARLLLLTLAFAAPLAAQSQTVTDERAEVEEIKAQTMALLQALVDAGLLTREKAEAIVNQAKRAAHSTVPVDQGAGSTAVAAAAPAAAASATAPAVIHVPYISETTKAQLREQIKQEVMAQARAEHWAQPDALPDWLNRISLEGDLRVRYEDDLWNSSNFPASSIQSLVAGNGAPLSSSPVWYPDILNTTNTAGLLSFRARFGINAKISDSTKAGIRLASGPASNGQTSTSQTFGSGFNRYAINIERAFIEFHPSHDTTLVAGRFANPFYGSDLAWPEDLNFDGLAGSVKPRWGERTNAYVTAGAFPLFESSLGNDTSKWLFGAQIGANHQLDDNNRVGFSLAGYDFHNIAGVAQSNFEGNIAASTDPSYLSRQYPSNWRLRGNTLFNIYPQSFNGVATTGAPVWGLVSRFRPIDLGLEYFTRDLQFAPLDVTFDYIRNTAWSQSDILQRVGPNLASNFTSLRPMTRAMQLRFNLGAPRIDKVGDWQAFFAWRRFDRDAWVDAFTATTWNLGGTNYQGYAIGASYGIAPRTSLGVRWASTHNLTDGQPQLGSGSAAVTNLSDVTQKIDILQVELNSRF